MRVQENNSAVPLSSMLELFGAQVEASLSDLKSPAQQCNILFSFVSICVDQVSKELNGINGGEDKLDSVLNQLNELKGLANKATVEMQSYDRVEQRLSHVRDSLLKITDSDTMQQENGSLQAFMCAKLLDDISSSHSIKHESELFNLMQDGASRQLLMTYASKASEVSSEEDSCDNTELF